MKTVFHSAASRGHAQFDWLNTFHTFSFANYYDPNRMHFGALRVLNDDTIAASRGFGMHPHSDMEIITIPLSGAIEHCDDMGNRAIIKQGDIQVMSAGTGIEHSEFNIKEDQDLRLLQIWVLPRKGNVVPRYQQMSLDSAIKSNCLQQIISPSPDDDGLWIHQDAWFNLGWYEAHIECHYTVHSENNGIYFFVIEGSVIVNEKQLNARDGIGIAQVTELKIATNTAAHFLIMEVPLTRNEKFDEH